MRLIDANALKEDLEKWFPKFTLEGIEPKTLFNQILHDIDNAPTVKTYCYFCGQTEHGKIEERTQGEWNRIDYPLKAKRNVIIYTCNLCGEISDSNKYNYCPNCGTKMKQD